VSILSPTSPLKEIASTKLQALYKTGNKKPRAQNVSGLALDDV
jgi:hypothetical protein